MDRTLTHYVRMADIFCSSEDAGNDFAIGEPAGKLYNVLGTCRKKKIQTITAGNIVSVNAFSYPLTAGLEMSTFVKVQRVGCAGSGSVFLITALKLTVTELSLFHSLTPCSSAGSYRYPVGTDVKPRPGSWRERAQCFNNENCE